MAVPTDPVARHREVAAGFTAAAAAVADWDAPSPVPGWTARDVVRPSSSGSRCSSPEGPA